MEKLIKMSILVNAILAANVSVYPEHNPIHESDYLHLHFNSVDLKQGTEQTASKKLIYKLPIKLNHDETFIVKICPEGTVNKITSNNSDEADVLKACLSDYYNSILGFNHYVEVPLYQYNVHNFYKTCFFGGAVPEAERSLIQQKAEDIHANKSFSEGDLFYTESEEILKKYEDSKHFNYRLKQSEMAKDDFRCTLQFDIADNFNIDNFNGKIHYIKKEKTASIVVIEYDQLKKENNYNPIIKRFFEEDTTELNNRRAKIVDSLQKSVHFKTSQFLSSKLTYKIMNNDVKPGEPLRVVLAKPGVKKAELLDFPFTLKKNEYIRFVPFVCKSVFSDMETSSYMFINSKDCIMAGDTKYLIQNDGDKYKFVSLQEDGVIKTNTISLDVLAMEFEFFAKDKDNVVYTIKGFEEFSDVVYDSEKSIIYYVSYQKTETREDGELKTPPATRKSRTIPIEMNGKDKTTKRLLGELDRVQISALFLITVFACVAFGGMFLWGSSILVAISLFIIILCVIVVVSRKDYRILAEGEMSMDYKSSIASLIPVDNIRKFQSRVTELSLITPEYFKNASKAAAEEIKAKGNSMVIVDIETYNKKLNNIDKKYAKKSKKGVTAIEGLEDLDEESQKKVQMRMEKNEANATGKKATI